LGEGIEGLLVKPVGQAELGIVPPQLDVEHTREELAAAQARFNVALDTCSIPSLLSSSQNAREFGQPLLGGGYVLKNTPSLSLQQPLGNEDHNGSLLAPDGVTGAVGANRFSVHENCLESGVCELDQLLLTGNSEGGDIVKARGEGQR
jgi:hypothetical protein